MIWLKNKILLGVMVVIVALAGYSYYALSRPLPLVKPSLNNLSADQVQLPSKLSWPKSGESAVGVVGSSILDTNGPQASLPTASTAKLLTALMILKAKPLGLNQSGPTITLSANDVAIYDNYVGEQGSVVPVVLGEQLSEYQMLEGMLLPSANNFADSLAIWAYGSLKAYAASANQYLSQLGLSGTHVGDDASGYLPSTVSTAHDLVKLGELVMQTPVLASIVKQPSASGLPVVGSIKNVNALLGMDNIVGIKTGNTDQAGGVFVGAAQTMIGGKLITIVSANVGATTLASALSSSLPLLKTAQTNFQTATLIKSGSVVASYKLPWSNQKLAAVVNSPVVVNVWDGDLSSISKLKLHDLSYPASAGQTVGKVMVMPSGLVNSNLVSIQLSQALPKASIWWRLLHP